MRLQVLNIKYPHNSDIATKLAGQTILVELSVDSSEQGIKRLMEDVNAYLLRERDSPVSISDMIIDYRGELRGLNDFAALSQKVTVKMTINGYVMGEIYDDGQSAKLIDLNWRTFIISQPLFVKTQYGMMDINRPSGFIAATIPTLLHTLANDGTVGLLNRPALDFSNLSIPMEQWRWDYDRDEHVTVIITAGSIGRPLQGEKHNVVFDHEGTPYGLELNIPPPSGTIQILGFAKAYAVSGDVALVYEDPGIIVTRVTPMSMQILLALGGVMAVIALVVLLKTRK